MSEYISREAVIKVIQNIINLYHETYVSNARAETAEWCLKKLKELPTADVMEVRHGRWIKDDETGEPICSVCHSGKPTRAVISSVVERNLRNYEIRYCYYCGALMDESEGEDNV